MPKKIVEADMGFGVFVPESDDTSINVGNYVQILAEGPDEGLIYQVIEVITSVDTINAVKILNIPRSVYPISDVKRTDLIGEVQGPDLAVARLRIRAEESGMYMALAIEGEFTRPAYMPIQFTQWIELEGIANLANVLIQGPIDKNVYLIWEVK
jgi:hypothetical protein